MSHSNKKKLSASVWLGSKRVLFLPYVHSFQYVPYWLNSKNVRWSVINYYDRRTRKFLKRVYNKK